MLVLTRRLGESITIGEDVVVTVLSVTGGQIRLGITAPQSVRVLRQEILKGIQEENNAAAKGAGGALPLDTLAKRWSGIKIERRRA
ncbi:MAG TPA: carbon storage regulator CsrA [Verrucomicrobiae bacterium]|jgi:carbon storage regulator|nr:carbon storage regulator CsrA [Verrucomicrobiae bacterium]